MSNIQFFIFNSAIEYCSLFLKVPCHVLGSGSGGCRSWIDLGLCEFFFVFLHMGVTVGDCRVILLLLFFQKRGVVGLRGSLLLLG